MLRPSLDEDDVPAPKRLATGSVPTTVPPILLGQRGLNNLGNTCFMNSVLQVLLHCPPVVRFFLGDHHNRFECMARSRQSPTGGENSADGGSTASRRPCLACEMDLLFTQCFSGKRAPFSPHSFLHAMWSNSEYFAGYEQQDAHEFLIAALSSIYAGLLQPRLLARQVGTGMPAPLGSARSGDGVNLGAQDLQRVFTGVLRSDVTCLSCQSTSTKYEDFQDISLDLSRTPSTEEDGSSPLLGSLAACLRSFTRAERLLSAERCWCTHCGKLQDSAKQLSIYRLPNVLCFHLKRFKHTANSKTPSTKIDTFVEFPLHSLNMRPHTSAHVCGVGTSEEALALEPTPEHLYDLFGVAVHHGTMQNGHYTSYVRTQADWFHFDDAVV